MGWIWWDHTLGFGRVRHSINRPTFPEEKVWGWKPDSGKVAEGHQSDTLDPGHEPEPGSSDLWWLRILYPAGRTPLIPAFFNSSTRLIEAAGSV